MKAALQVALAASLAAGVTAQPHNHLHRHQHARKHDHPAPLDARELITDYQFVTDTVYVDVDGTSIDTENAVEGLDDGTYKIVGESTPKSVTPTPTSTPTPTPTPSSSSTSVSSTSAATTTSASGGEFIEVKIGHSDSTSSSSTSSAAASTATASSSSSSSSGSTGVDADFPDGEIDCSDFDSLKNYGAVELENTAVAPFLGYMHVGVDAYTLGQTDDITVSISEPTSGDPTAGTFVGYACPAGYDAAQWPAAQGSSGQSVGGLWCGSDEKLHLTRSDTTSKLCQAGAGNVHIVSKLSKPIYICKTWYPGNEGMYLPTLVSAGETVDLYNPLQEESYTWQGLTTSAQYYLNMQDVPVGQACTWTPDSPYTDVAGNWAGMNLGTSVDSDGDTFLSIFHNTPTSDAALDYNIQVAGTASGGEGDVSGCPCKYEYSSNSVTGGGNGCTVSTSGGDIYIILSDD
ncbi:Sperm-associated antigen 4 protein [Gnomoniopsis sp. IMI 355080]|nr:Sperm-associated antigen 4 protein [Gnomoniopsis sp. IMI 355080]